MISKEEYLAINKELTNRLKLRNNQIKKAWGFGLLLVSFVIIIFIVIFPKQFSSSVTLWILPTYGSMLILTALIGFLISFFLCK